MLGKSFFKNFSIPKKLSFWSKGGQSVLGLDIGSSSVKLVQLRMEKERAVLETYGELSLGPYTGLSVGQAVRLPDEKMSEMIKDLIKESGAKSNEVVLSIPLSASFVLLIDVPAMSDHELNESIPFEARRYIPVPINEVALDWWPIPEGFSQKHHAKEGEESDIESRSIMSVLMVAIHKEVIERYQSVVNAAGLKIKGFEIEVFSTVRSLISQELAPILMLDIGASSTKIAIVDYGIVRVAHNLEGGSQSITTALSRSLGIDFVRAEEMKREIGFSDRPEHKEVKSIMEPMLDHMFSETTRIMQEYQRKSRRSITRVVLMGGGSKLNGIVDYSVKKFGVETSLGDPFKKVQYPVFLRPLLKEIGPSFAQAIGLAVREL